VIVLKAIHCLGWMVFLLIGPLVSGCNGGDGEDVVEKSSFQMPVKENTWVRKETVRKTKDDFFASAGKKSVEVPIDSALAEKLKKASSLSINTQQECLQQATALDKKRTEVQKRGGLWHAYERVPTAKPYSDYGMQLDSQTNRLVFSLKYLCQNAQGLQLTGWGAEMARMRKNMGKENFRTHFLDLGEVPADVDNWVRFAEFAIQGENRKIPYSKISESLGKAQSLMGLYDDLSQRKVDDATLQTFLAEGATLLSVINESFKSDPQLILALQDENILPFEDIKGEM